MDGKDFDRLTRSLVGSASRRRAVKLLGGGVLGGLLGLAGLRRAAAGYDRRCTRFILSGGESPNDAIFVDDYILVKLNGNRLRVEQNGQPQSMVAGPRDPLRFYAQRGDALRIQAYDTGGSRRFLDTLYLHCIRDGEGSQRLFGNRLPIDKRGGGSPQDPVEFFDETYTI